MKLDVKCVRSVLLEMEKEPLNQSLDFGELKRRLPQYSEDELHYACYKLYEAGYIHALRVDMDNVTAPYFPSLNDITFKGHEFLNNIRDDTVFQKALGIAGKAGSFSLETVAQAASAVIAGVISAKLGI